MREAAGEEQARRRKREVVGWSGEAQSRPKLGEGCMAVQVDMRGGERVRVEAA